MLRTSVLVLGAASVFLAAIVAGGQTGGIDVSLRKQQGEPVEIVEAFHNGAPDWVRNLTLKIKNASDKPIGSVDYSIELPELKESGMPVVLVQRFGDPEKPVDKTLKAGQVQKLSFTSESKKKIDSLLYKGVRTSSQPSMSITGGLGPTASPREVAVHLTKGVVRLERVVFSDGTVWRRQPNAE